MALNLLTKLATHWLKCEPAPLPELRLPQAYREQKRGAPQRATSSHLKI
jgi:hypothetical protein